MLTCVLLIGLVSLSAAIEKPINVSNRFFQPRSQVDSSSIFHLATSASELGAQVAPGLARIPMHFDRFPRRMCLRAGAYEAVISAKLLPELTTREGTDEVNLAGLLRKMIQTDLITQKWPIMPF